ncbi:MAG: zinc-ribbon domain-containing protein [Dehalococcoidia bacterium]
MQQRCPNCGSPVIPGQRFCGGCGAQLSLSCPQCRITVSPGTRFCPNCGTTLGGGPTQQPGWGQPGGPPPHQPGMPPQQPGMPPQQPGMPPQQPGWGQQQAWAPPAPKSQSSSSRPFLVILLIVLVIGLGGLVYWQFGDQLLGFFNSSIGGGSSTIVDTTKPVITFSEDPTVSVKSASIFWHTDEFASTQVEYGTSNTYGTLEPAQPADDPTGGQSLGVIDHSVLLSDLQPTTTYHYRVKSKDKAGNEAISSDDRTFTTIAATE